MIGALEKQKFVYVLNRDAAANLTISSPLEAHKSHNICFALTALDCGFDNPIFAAIELDYSDADQVGERVWGGVGEAVCACVVVVVGGGCYICVLGGGRGRGVVLSSWTAGMRTRRRVHSSGGGLVQGRTADSAGHTLQDTRLVVLVPPLPTSFLS